MSKSTLETMYYKQGILPSVLYGILLWGNYSNLSDVNTINIRAARFMMKVKKSIPNELVLEQVGWKSIEFYYKGSLSSKTYKIQEVSHVMKH